MSNTDKIAAIERSYQGKDFQMIERLEAYSRFPGETEFDNFLLILLVMIERSEAQESAATLLWKKIFTENIFRNDTDPAVYGRAIMERLKRLGVFPYRNLVTSIGRLIATVIYDIGQQNTRHITSVISREQLLLLNEYFLGEHIRQHPLNNDLLNISYNCIARIETGTTRIFISDRAIGMIRASLAAGQLKNYLSCFIRPYYTAMSSHAVVEARYHVPEPFYGQFFRPEEELTDLIGPPPIGERTLESEVWEFMMMFRQNRDRNIPYVDIARLGLTKGLHRNVRFPD